MCIWTLRIKPCTCTYEILNTKVWFQVHCLKINIRVKCTREWLRFFFFSYIFLKNSYAQTDRKPFITYFQLLLRAKVVLYQKKILQNDHCGQSEFWLRLQINAPLRFPKVHYNTFRFLGRDHTLVLLSGLGDSSTLSLAPLTRQQSCMGANGTNKRYRG